MAICRRVGLSRGVPMDCPSQVLEDFRVMDVAANTHAFLHGLETTVPGSYLKGQLLCGQLLKQKGASWEQCRSLECAVCSLERQSRYRVLQERAPSAYVLGDAPVDAALALEGFKANHPTFSASL